MENVSLADRPAAATAERILPPKTLASPQDWARRRKIAPTGFSHCAFRSRDLEKTRYFYEEIIGMPLVAAEKIKGVAEPQLNGKSDLIHIFFEMADGSSIGFFGIAPHKLKPFEFPADELQLHFSVQMESQEAIAEIEARAKAAGFKTSARAFGPFCYSCYVYDPDGIMLELCHHRPKWFTDIDLKKARATLDEWIANGECWT